MARNEIKLSYTFVNPNTEAELAEQLQKIIIEKLLALRKEFPDAACQPKCHP